jgi:hypothetical protein
MNLVENGLLKDTEAEHILEDLEKEIRHVITCGIAVHPGEIPLAIDEENRLEEVDEEK